jgi:hypothetical protein
MEAMAAEGVEIDEVEKSPNLAGFDELSATAAVVAATAPDPVMVDEPATVNSPEDPGVVAVSTKLLLLSTEAVTASFHVVLALINTASRSLIAFLVVCTLIGDRVVVPVSASLALNVIDPVPTPALVMVTDRAVAVAPAAWFVALGSHVTDLD